MAVGSGHHSRIARVLPKRANAMTGLADLLPAGLLPAGSNINNSDLLVDFSVGASVSLHCKSYKPLKSPVIF